MPRARSHSVTRLPPAPLVLGRALCLHLLNTVPPAAAPNSTPGPSPRSRRVRMLLLWLPILLASAWLLYVAGVAWALRSQALRNAINSKPDKFSIDWSSASSWFPGSFHIRGLHFVGQGTSSQYYGRMEEARFRVRLLPLLGQVISVGHFDGRGVEFQIRRPDPTNGAAPPDHAFYPPIPGLESLPRRTAPRSARGPASWWIRIDEVLFREIERIWIYGSRLDGPATLSAALDMQIEGPFQTRLHQLAFPDATLVHNGATVANHLVLQLDGNLGPLVFDVDDVPDERLFEFISANLKIAGDLQTVALLRERLGSHDHIDFAGGGRIDGSVIVNQGVLQKDTQLSVRSPKLRIHLNGYTFEGDATVEDRVSPESPEPLARLEVRLRDLAILRNGIPIGAVPGPVFNLSSQSRDLKVTARFRDADLALHLEPIHLPDAAWLSEFLPASSGVAVTGGAITVSADLHAASGRPVQGRIDIAGDSIATRIRESDYQATVQLAVRLVDGSGGPQMLRLGPTELVVTNLFVPGLPRDRQEGWHATLAIPEATLDLTNPSWNLAGRVQLDLRDTRPILAVLRDQPDAPGWLRLMPTIRSLSGEGTVEASPAATRLTGFQLTGKATDFRAELLLRTNATLGIAYARYGVLSAGFDLRDPSRSRWRILGAKRWYERALASPLRHPDAPEPEEADLPEQGQNP